MCIIMDKKVIREILIREQYPEFMIETTIAKIENFSPEVADAFKSWSSDNCNVDIEIEGFTFADLVSKWGMNPVGALITLDWLVREPGKAKMALSRGIR